MPPTVATLPHRLAGLGLILLLVALAVLRSYAGTRLDGYTVDEPWHIVAGVSYVRTGDFRLNPEHPPLSKLAVAMAIPDSFRLRPLSPLVEKTQERELVEETMYFDNDSRGTQAAARVGMWTFHAGLMVLLGLALWQAVGLAWAAGALAFLAIEPTIAAHLPVVMTDLPLALCFGLAAVCAGLLASQWRWRWAVACGAAVGLALGSKHSALAGVAGIAVVLAVAALWGFRQGGLRTVAMRTAQLALAALLSLVILWAQYGLRFNAGPDGSDAYNRAMPDKIADLNIPHWREGIAFADHHRLLPRAYLWGLADTVRAGVEGRGQSTHLLWGTKYAGQAPWFTWPSVMASKVPLALIALSLLGLALLPRSKLTPRARWVLAALLGGSAAHLLALMGSQGTYGGVRHALPLVMSLAVLAGAAVAWAWQTQSRPGIAAVVLLFVAALGMTIREPRLWEYHNELAGGSANAYRYFGNEGLDLGQRYPDIRAFHDRIIQPAGARLYSDYWFGEKQAIADRLNLHRRVADMQDDNVAGVYEGYFLVGMSATLPEPGWGWDPEKAFAGTREVARLGYVQVRQGRMTNPMGRALSVYYKTVEYLYRKNGTDSALVARRLEEVVKVLSPHAGAGIELGNAYLRLGDAAAARAAYRRLLDQKEMPVQALVRAQLEAQLARIDAGDDPASIKPLRNPEME
jgi:hypothetical protein